MTKSCSNSNPSKRSCAGTHCSRHQKHVVSGTCGQPSFPLGRTPSLSELRGLPTALFACFVGTMGPLDSPAAYMSGYDSQVFPDRPRPFGEGVAGVSRFSHMEFPRMLRVSDSAASTSNWRF